MVFHDQIVVLKAQRCKQTPNLTKLNTTGIRAMTISSDAEMILLSGMWGGGGAMIWVQGGNDLIYHHFCNEILVHAFSGLCTCLKHFLDECCVPLASL